VAPAFTTQDEIVRLDGGRRLRIRIDNPDAGRPVLLINGLTRGLEYWDPLVAVLGVRAIVRFDPPGIGLSAASPFPLSIPQLAELASRVLDYAGVESADVIGFSHGGAVSQQLAHQSAERVSTLALLASACGVGSAMGGLESLAVMLKPDRGGRSTPAADPLTVFYRSLAFSFWSSVPFLSSLLQPTIIITGSHDRLVPPLNGRILNRRIPNSRFEVINAGHDLQSAAHAEGVARLLDEFH
jgi:pimeloyl-ACP methyl ester carboxylesterase